MPFRIILIQQHHSFYLNVESLITLRSNSWCASNSRGPHLTVIYHPVSSIQDVFSKMRTYYLKIKITNPISYQVFIKKFLIYPQGTFLHIRCTIHIYGGNL